MKEETKMLLLSLREDEQSLSDYMDYNYDFFEDEKKESFSAITLRNIFFYKNKKFSYIDLISQGAKFTWIKNMLDNFCNILISNDDKNNENSYEMLNDLFTINYKNIKENFSEFLEAFEKKQFKIKYDLFYCLISFFSFLNKNKNYSDIISNLEQYSIINKLKISYNNKNSELLWNIITNYCKLSKIPILYSDNKFVNAAVFDIKLNELKCLTEICPVNESYKKLVQTLFFCITNKKDLRDNRPEKVKTFIEDIFAILNICLKNIKFGDDTSLLDIYDVIYNKSFEYSSNDFNENYNDFVIQYFTKYKLSSEDFFHLFVNGLLEGKFKETFINLQLKEFNDDINSQKTIQFLINKMLRKKKKNKKKNKTFGSNDKNTGDKNAEIKEHEISFSKKEEKVKINASQSKNEIKDNIAIKQEIKYENNLIENKKDKLSKMNTENNDKKNEIEMITQKTDNNSPNAEISFKTDNIEKVVKELIQQNKVLVTQVNDLTVQVNELKSQNKDFKAKIEELQVQIEELQVQNEELHEENEELHEENFSLMNDIAIKDIKITKLFQEMNKIKKKLEIISFRDLSKIILDNMIKFVKERDKNFFKGILKRKKKIERLNKKYKYKEIEFMKNPISEISEKYYNSNILSHVPEIVNIVNRKPFGLLKDPIGDISKRFYQIIIDSKSDNVFNFINEKLNIRKEIDTLYK